MKNATRTPTVAQWELADSYLPHTWAPCQTAGEVWEVLDSIENGEDPIDNLGEYRHWRSPAGRRQEVDEMFESAHPLAETR